jgi:hypothetical protein
MPRLQGNAGNTWPVILLLSLTVGSIVDVVARVVAHLAVDVRTPSIRNVLDDTFASVWAPLPIALAAAFAACAAYMRGPRSVLLVLPLALSPHAYWTYKAERGMLLALAERKWTAAALGPAFAWVFSVALVTVAGAVALFIARVAYDDPRDTS